MKKRIWFTLIIFCVSFLTVFKISVVQASENIVFSDDFNDQEIVGWNVARSIQWNNVFLPCMNGNTEAGWSAVNGMLKIDINSPACVTELVPVNLDLSKFTSYSIDFDWLLENGTHMDRNFALLWKDPQNWIGIKIIDDSLILHKFFEGKYQIIPGSEVHFPFEENHSYHLKAIYSRDNRIMVSIDNDLLIDVYDPIVSTPYSGSYSFAAQASVGAISSSTTSFDNIVVTSLDDTLGVNLIKQGQEPWGPLEYDSASEWATANQGKTFKDWGCALTSAVMIMNYYGINKMPDGNPVTPLTLNNWLLENNGYFNGGNVSFAAIAALTKKLSEQYGFPTLEYSRNDVAPREAAVTEINAHRPVIIVKPGHFMVADGIVPTVDDLFIKDPFFPFTQFSEHQANHISTRFFTPSITETNTAVTDSDHALQLATLNTTEQLNNVLTQDVSYLSIAADQAAQIRIFDSTGHLLDVVPQIEELENPNAPGQFSPAVQLIEVPKPAVGTYRIEVLSTEGTNLSATEIATITSNGNITYHTIPANQHIAQLILSENESSQIDYLEPEGFFKLRLLIESLWQENEILNPNLYTELSSLASTGETSTSNAEGFVTVKMIRRVISRYHVKVDLTTTAKNELMKQLQELQVSLLTV